MGTPMLSCVQSSSLKGNGACPVWSIVICLGATFTDLEVASHRTTALREAAQHAACMHDIRSLTGDGRHVVPRWCHTPWHAAADAEKGKWEDHTAQVSA